MVPSDRRYTKDHEWVQVAGEIATIGITEFAQGELGDIVYVEAPEIGKSVRAGDVLGTIESVKAVSELYAPVSGTVTEINASLPQAPETLNRDPHGSGWICKMSIASPAEIESLLDASAYSTLIG